MSNDLSLQQRILKLVDIFRNLINPENLDFNVPENMKEEFENLWESIEEDLMWYPGTLIYLKDKSELKTAQVVIDAIWSGLDRDEIFDEMTGGGYAGLLVDIIGDYADRVKMLKPTFISINPKKSDFQIYFQEAMRAWLFGLNNSSLILCCSIIENTLTEELHKINIDLVKTCPLEKLIDNAAKERLITFEEKNTAHEIRKLRNNSIHELHSISSKQTYDALINTKNLVEKLLSEDPKF